jgi:hypothetical protein
MRERGTRLRAQRYQSFASHGLGPRPEAGSRSQAQGFFQAITNLDLAALWAAWSARVSRFCSARYET